LGSLRDGQLVVRVRFPDGCSRTQRSALLEMPRPVATGFRITSEFAARQKRCLVPGAGGIFGTPYESLCVRFARRGVGGALFVRDGPGEGVESGLSHTPEGLEAIPGKDFRDMMWYLLNPPAENRPWTPALRRELLGQETIGAK
jgi:hypothetical protein